MSNPVAFLTALLQSQLNNVFFNFRVDCLYIEIILAFMLASAVHAPYASPMVTVLPQLILVLPSVLRQQCPSKFFKDFDTLPS